MAETVTLDFIARQIATVIEEQGRMRDDMAVLLAMTQRLDGTMQGLVAEVRAQHARQDRQARDIRQIGDRMGALEGHETAE